MTIILFKKPAIHDWRKEVCSWSRNVVGKRAFKNLLTVRKIRLL